MTGETIIEFNAPYPPWSINQERSKHWSWRAKREKAYRFATFYEARTSYPHPDGPSVVTVELPFARKARRDPHNFLPAVKAIVDGLVDAGYWRDDTADYVTVAEPILVVDHLTKPQDAHRVRVIVTPREDADDGE